MLHYRTVIEHSFVPPLAVIPVKQRRIPGNFCHRSSPALSDDVHFLSGGFTKSLIPRNLPAEPMTQYEFRNKQLLKRASEVSAIQPARMLPLTRCNFAGVLYR